MFNLAYTDEKLNINLGKTQVKTKHSALMTHECELGAPEELEDKYSLQSVCNRVMHTSLQSMRGLEGEVVTEELCFPCLPACARVHVFQTAVVGTVGLPGTGAGQNTGTILVASSQHLVRLSISTAVNEQHECLICGCE